MTESIDLSDFGRRAGTSAAVKWDGKNGSIDTPAIDFDPGQEFWDTLIQDWGLDPAAVEIVPGTVHIRAWDANIGGGDTKRLRYYRASIRQRTVSLEDRAEIDELIKLAMKRKPPKKPTKSAATIPATFLIALSDWQTGKTDGGSTNDLINRVIGCQDAVIEQLYNLCATGRRPEKILICGCGDLIEQCAGFYPNQTFTVDVDRRTQMRIVRNLILRLVDILVDKFPAIPIELIGVPGNHGEGQRVAGKFITTVLDNDDLAIFEQLGEILRSNPERYSDVVCNNPDSYLNDDDLTVTTRLSNVIVTFAHGHQFGKGGDSGMAKAEKWLAGQALGILPVADCQIFVSAHVHHFALSENTGRTVIIVPALDNGSKWFTAKTGRHAAPGMLTMLIGEYFGPGRPYGSIEIC